MPDYDDERGFDEVEFDEIPDEPLVGESAAPTEAAQTTVSVKPDRADEDDQAQAVPESTDDAAQDDSDYVYVYVDEHGNEVDLDAADEVAAGGPDAVVTQPGLDRLDRKAKLALAGGAVAVVAVVLGGIVFALNGVGNQNTVDDVRAGAKSKYAQASSSVVAKSSEVRGEAEAVVIDTCRTGKVSGPGGLGDAMVDGGAEKPRLRLDVISAAPLPGAFIKARSNADGAKGAPSLLQLTKSGWAAYTTMPLTRAEKKAETARPGFWKADVQATEDKIAVTGDHVWAGGDTGGAGSCEPAGPGVYAATGKIPADAAGLVDGQASVDAIQGVAGQADKAVAMMGNSIALVKLVENTSEGGDAASSSEPSK